MVIFWKFLGQFFFAMKVDCFAVSFVQRISMVLGSVEKFTLSHIFYSSYERGPLVVL